MDKLQARGLAEDFLLKSSCIEPSRDNDLYLRGEIVGMFDREPHHKSRTFAAQYSCQSAVHYAAVQQPKLRELRIKVQHIIGIAVRMLEEIRGVIQQCLKPLLSKII